MNLTSALRAQGGAALAGGYSFQFTIAVAGGMLSFQEIGRWSTAPAFVPHFIYGGDLDADGDPPARASQVGGAGRTRSSRPGTLGAGRRHAASRAASGDSSRRHRIFRL